MTTSLRASRRTTVLAIPGVGVTNETKYQRFPGKVTAGLAASAAAAGLPDPSPQLDITVASYHRLLKQRHWSGHDARPVPRRSASPMDTPEWECLCCLDGASRTPKDHALSLLDRLLPRVPMTSRANGELLRLLPEDKQAAAAFVTRPTYRRLIIDSVANQTPPSTDIVITHSLGTLVAIHVLARLAPSLQPRLLITCGSPAGAALAQQCIDPHVRYWSQITSTTWLNVHDKMDAATGGKAIPKDDFSRVMNLRVRNASDVDANPRPHNFLRYLSHPDVSAVVNELLNTQANTSLRLRFAQPC